MIHTKVSYKVRNSSKTRSVVARILELEEQLRKLDGSYYEYLGGGLTKHKLTPFDTELKCLPSKYTRSQNIQRIIYEAFQKARDKCEKGIYKDIV